MRYAVIIVLLLGALSLSAMAQSRPAALQVVENKGYVLGPAIVQTVPSGMYFHITAQATQKTMPEVMRLAVPELIQAVQKAGVVPQSALLLVYHGMSSDPNAEFEFDLGYLVPAGTKAAGEATVEELPEFKCVSMLFTGKTELVGKAYEALFPALFAAGKVPSQEMRQMVLHHESDTSVNNIMLIQIGVQ